MPSVPAVRRDGLARAVIVVAAGFALLAAVAATGDAATTLLGILSSPGRLGLDGVATLVVGLASLAVGVAGAALAARSRLSERQLLLLGLAVLLGVRLGAILGIDSPISPDGSAYQDLARRIADEGFVFADRPTGYPFLLAVAYRLLGDNHLAHELLNLALAMAGGWLLFDLAKRMAGRQAAILSLIAYAILPGLLLLTPVRLADTAIATLVIAACWAGSRMIEGSLAWAVASGLVLAASQYVRPIAPLLLVALLVAAGLGTTWRRWVPMALVMALAFVIAMLPAFAYNLATYGDLSPSTSSFGGWSLYMGTNQAVNGGFNRPDADFIHALPGPLWDQSAEAGRLALGRIAADPLGFGGLVVRKFAVMWGTEQFVVQYAMDFRQVGGMQGVEVGVNVVAQLAWLALLLSASGALLMIRGQRLQPAVIVAVCLLLAEALLHVFVEVKPRYHAHLEPLLILIASLGVARWITRGWSWAEILRGAPRQPHRYNPAARAGGEPA